MAGATSSSSNSLSQTRLITTPKTTKLLRPLYSTTTTVPTFTRHRTLAAALTCSASPHPVTFSQGPSCIFVGPIETASQETLEALYRQARDAYYSGNPLIMDDMFDRVELKLRWYGSKDVVKYPRCSLRRQSTYADAQDDPSQVFALASVWSFIFVFGSSLCLLPVLYTVKEVYQDTFNANAIYNSQLSAMQFLTMLNCALFMLLGSAIGFPVALAAAKQLQGLWRNDLVALKGACPNCGEEVFAFVRSDQSNSSPHRDKCHVCECRLEFRTQAEKTLSRFGRRWVHGRVYLICDRWSHRRQMFT